MKFMEPIETTMGKGLVVGAMSGGRVTAVVTVVKVCPSDEKGRPAVEKKYCPHRVFAWCEMHRVWYLDGSECPQCERAKGAGGE